MKAFLPLLFCAGLAVADGPHASLPAIGSLDGLGVNIHFTEPKLGELEMIKAAGFKWVRMDLTWAATERTAGEYDFRAYDGLVAALEKNGLRAVFILDYGNKLYDDGLPPHTQAGRAAFAKWATAAVRRYAGKGYLWELWNEPNIAQFWKPKPDVQQYIALAKAVSAELRRAKLTPGECLIGPATSTVDLVFLEECCKGGLLEIFDGISVHPYRQKPPETVEEDYRAVRLLIRKYGPKEKLIPVLSGEWGYSDGWPCGVPRTGTIVEQFLTNITNDVPLSIWYDWRNDGLDPGNPEHHFGIVEHESVKDEKLPFKPKEAYTQVKTLTEELRAYRFSKRLLVSNTYSPEQPAARILLFTRGKTEQKLAIYWTGDSQGDTHVEVPASHGLFRVRDERSRGYHRRIAAGDDGIYMNAAWWGVKFLTPEKPNDFLRVAAASPRLPLEHVFHWPETAWGPSAKRLISGLRNSLNRKLTLIYGFTSSESVAPGKSTEREWGVGTGNRKERDTFTDEMSIDMGNGQNVRFIQGTVLVCTNPLTIDVLPPATDALIVKVGNPSGEPASLTIRDYDAGVDAAVPVTLGAGEFEKVVRVPLHSSSDRIRKVEVAIDQTYDVGQARGSMTQTESFGEWLSLPPFDAALLKLAEGGDANVTATCTTAPTAASPPDSNTAAISLKYMFPPGWKFVELKAKLPPILPSRLEDGWFKEWPRRLGLWVHGDGGGCQIRARFTDAAGQTFQPDGPKIEWKGWRYITLPLSISECATMAHWGGIGVRDGEIHYPIQWDSIFLLDNVSKEPVEGEIYLSAPTLIY